ncbi:HAD family phosphatase [uncultured Slackia sp.]|uniref:HAD family hydrolase n=1 Tax=uncultured Slackia sp. TaxID=665903 RepID=UPI0026E06F3C|nr:HAD family phosphatase [uncultured Slackia sp.]
MRPSLAGVGFIFDCDGTLLDTMDAWLSMEDTFAARVGGHIDSAMREKLCTMTMPEEAVFLHETFGVGDSPAALEAEIDEYFMSYYSEHAQATPGAEALIEEVRRRDIPCAIASSSPHAYLEAGLGRTGLLDAFASVFSTEDVKASKRERKIYDAAAKSMKAVPELTWCFDDAVYALRAMKKAGFKTVGVYDRDTSGTVEQLRDTADTTVLTLEDVDIDELLALQAAHLAASA